MKRLFSLSPYILCFLLAVDFYLIFLYSPEEANQGLVQKIFYFHVSSAFAMYLGLGLGGLFAILYLWKREIRWDSLSYTGVSVGFLFCTMVLASGPVWAKPVWGAWWTWDPRLTATLLLWLVFFSYFLLRNFYDGESKGRLYAAVLTLFGILDIPLIFLSVKLWRGIHPSLLGQEQSMPVEMRLTLIFTNVTVLTLFGILFWIRYRVQRMEERLLRA